MEKYAYSSSPGSLGRRGGGDSRLQFRRVFEAWALPSGLRRRTASRVAGDRLGTGRRHRRWHVD